MAYFQQNQQQAQGGPSQPSSPFAQQSSFYASTTAPNPNAQSFSGPQFGGGSTSGWGGASGSPAGGAGGYGQFGGGGYGGGGGGGQPQFGGGMQSVGGSGGMPANFGEKAKRNYLPGYLSSGGVMGQSEATPPQSGGDESRSWDSPTRRTSISGSPVSRFGNQSLFGSTRDGTPSRSPKASYAREPRAQLYRTEMEEDAPPTSSLTESASSDSLTDFPAPAPSVSPLPSTSPLVSHSAPSPAGYALHLFGFPSTSLSLVLSHFAQFGDILETTPSPSGGNWVTITYAQPWAAARAARRNGELLGGVLMIGVQVVDEDSLRTSLGPEQPVETKVAAPVRAPTSGVGKPVVLGSGSAFRPVAPTPPRRGFFGTGEPGLEGADPHASLFREKNRQAVLAQGQGQKGVLGKVSDMVFGW